MTRDVEVKLAFDRLPEVKLGAQDRLALGFGPSELVAKWRDDDRIAAAHDFVRGQVDGVIVRVVRPASELVRRKHETAAFTCDMAHARAPRIPSVGGWSAVELDALAIHGHPHAGP